MLKKFLFSSCMLALAALSYGQQLHDSIQVFFASGKYILTPEGRNSLNSASRKLATGTAVTIMGFCDPIGSGSYNDRLSNQRTKAVKDYLVSKGIDPALIVFRKGYGETKPVNGNRNEEERQLNRRVDLIISSSLTNVSQTSLESSTAKKNVDAVKQFSKEAMDSAKKGQTFRLKQINFYGGRHILLPESMDALEELINVMQQNPKLSIEIQGHICCRIGMDVDGEDLDTREMQLSLNRARSVYEYLVASGIEKSRMSYVGMAGKIPLVNPEITEADRRANRRVEIRVLDN
jgi:outer membrane protein OmpA-like peptidoglycan-associated protein